MKNKFEYSDPAYIASFFITPIDVLNLQKDPDEYIKRTDN